MFDNGYLYAFAASILFGAGAPVSKRLLEHVDPWMMAGALYLSAGLGLAVLSFLRNVFVRGRAKGPRLRGSNARYLAGATLVGGVAAPLLLMCGLARTSASQASLFFNVETVFTSLFAWGIFRERFDAKIVGGMLAIFAGGLLLTWTGTLTGHQPWGALLVVLACLCWGFDNNLTRRISDCDPIRISMIKSLVAGSVNVALARAMGAHWPQRADLGPVVGVGFASYGLSLICFVLALRHLGASRTSAIFSTGPFVGVALAVVWLGEPLTPRLVMAALLMAGGVFLYLMDSNASRPGSNFNQ